MEQKETMELDLRVAENLPGLQMGQEGGTKSKLCVYVVWCSDHCVAAR